MRLVPLVVAATLLPAPAFARADLTRERVVVVLRAPLRTPGRYGLRVTETYGSAFSGFAASVTAASLARLVDDPSVDFVAPDLPVSYEPLDQAYAVVPVGPQRTPHGVLRVGADVASVHAGDGRGAVGLGVAVLDTGVGPHSDLNVKGGVDCIDHRSYADPNGHGTHVAGTIAAKDDGDGVVGVAPGAPVYAVRVLPPSGTSGALSQLLCGLDWVAAHAGAVRVANLSLGVKATFRPLASRCGASVGDVLHVAICGVVRRGVVVVAAAGNGAPPGPSVPGGPDPIQNFNEPKRFVYPAAYPEVLAVTAMNDFDGRPGAASPAASCENADRDVQGPDDPGATAIDDAFAPYSNYTYVGDIAVPHTVAAPGTCVLSTYPGDKFAIEQGTSMAAPHVAGAVLDCLAAHRAHGSPASVVAAVRAEALRTTKTRGYDGGPDEPRFDATAHRYRYYGAMLDVSRC
jgi:subtilisin family serine protease